MLRHQPLEMFDAPDQPAALGVEAAQGLAAELTLIPRLTMFPPSLSHRFRWLRWWLDDRRLQGIARDALKRRNPLRRAIAQLRTTHGIAPLVDKLIGFATLDSM